MRHPQSAVVTVPCKNVRICVMIFWEAALLCSGKPLIDIKKWFILSVWSFTLLSNRHLRFSARAMNRRQIVSRCGDVQKNACMSREFFESGTFTIGWAGDMYTKAIYTFSLIFYIALESSFAFFRSCHESAPNSFKVWWRAKTCWMSREFSAVTCQFSMKWHNVLNKISFLVWGAEILVF